jgi:hypothetical protein
MTRLATNFSVPRGWAVRRAFGVAAFRAILGAVEMRDGYKIPADGERPATLNNGAGALTDYPSLREAVLAWRGLPPEQKLRATVKVICGPVYAAYQIDRVAVLL